MKRQASKVCFMKMQIKQLQRHSTKWARLRNYHSSPTRIHTIGARKNRLFTARLHNGSLQLNRSVPNYLMLSKIRNSHLHGAKQDCITWFETVVTGVFHVSVYGVFQFQCFTLKTVNQSLQMKQLPTFRNCSVKTDRMSGSNEKQKIYCQKVSPTKAVRTESLQKRRTSWTFGSIQAQHTKVC